MTRTIWKFPIRLEDAINIFMPIGAEVIAVDVQQGEVCIWAVVDPAAPHECRTFRCAGTGHSLPDGLGRAQHIGTVQLDGGALVFHLFDFDSDS